MLHSLVNPLFFFFFFENQIIYVKSIGDIEWTWKSLIVEMIIPVIRGVSSQERTACGEFLLGCGSH